LLRGDGAAVAARGALHEVLIKTMAHATRI
jgi:hypothetical protein